MYYILYYNKEEKMLNKKNHLQYWKNLHSGHVLFNSQL